MGLLDKFKSRRKAPEGYEFVDFEFTEEEAAAIRSGLQRYDDVFNEDAPEGTRVAVTHKMHDAMKARALVEYVEDLTFRLETGSETDFPAIMDKGIKAQMKAYAIHNLPAYLYRVAAMFDVIGNDAKAKQLFQQFVQLQSTFSPDEVDTLFLEQPGFDMDEAMAKAIQKIS
jgi:hypothetical protein